MLARTLAVMAAGWMALAPGPALGANDPSTPSPKLQAVVQFKTGVDLWLAGNRLKAVEAWRQAIRLDPNLAEAHFNLGVALRDLRILKNGKNCLAQDDPLACLFSIRHLAREPAGELKESLKSLYEATRLNPNHAPALRLKGVILGELERYEEAAGAMADYLQERPNDPEGHYLLCAAYRALGKFKMAAHACQDSIRMRHDYLEAYHLLGMIRIHLRQWNAAKKVFKEVIRLAPKSAAAWFNLGLALRGQGKTAKEIQAYQNGLALNPKDGALHLNLASAYDKLGQGSKAIDHTRRAREGFVDNQFWRQAAKANHNLGFYMNKYWNLTRPIPMF